MANYNYVAPIQYKSYSDMNKERLAAKAVKDAAKAKKLSAGDKQRQEYLDQLSGLSTKGWATAYRDELGVIVESARAQLRGPDGANVSWGPIADAIIRVTDLAELHRDNASIGRDEYESYLDENSPDPEGNTWDKEVEYTLAGFEQRRNIYNNVGLIGYSEETGMGYFPNDNWKPGDPEEHKTMKGFLLSQQNDDGTSTASGEVINGIETVIVNGQAVPIQGKPSDVASGGFGGLWNGDIKPRDTITPDNAFLNFKSQGDGASIFTTLANEYATSVKNGQLTQDAAYDKLKGAALGYLTGQDPSLTLRASAINMWEEKHKMEWSVMEDFLARDAAAQQELEDAQEGIQYADVNIETPWDMYAKAIADQASLKPKPPGTDSGGSWNTSKRLWEAASTNRYLNLEEASTGRAMDGVGIKNEQWKDMLSRNLGDEFTQAGYNIQTIKDNIEKVEYTSGNLNVSIPEGNLKYDGQNINRVTYYPEEDYVIIWRVDPDQGDQGPLPANSAWAYTEVAGGKPVALPFQIIYKHKDGESSDGSPITQQYRDLRDIFAVKMEEGSGFEDPLQALFDRAEAGNLD